MEYIIPCSKNFGSKKVWQIRTIGSLAENILWRNEVHLHKNVMEIVKIWEKFDCNLPNLPKFLTANVLYCTVS